MKTFFIDKSMKDYIVFSMHEDGIMTWHTVLTRNELAGLIDLVFGFCQKSSEPMTDIERIESNIDILNKRLLEVEKQLEYPAGQEVCIEVKGKEYILAGATLVKKK
jgi:CRISPR/Cas system-associated exonuclease Cas4 (RecB family)